MRDPSALIHGEKLARRRVLQVGSLAPLGWTAPIILGSSRSGIAAPARDLSCILIWLTGGPSQLDTFDPKPEAPAEIRGEFTAIPTTVSGIRVSETLPLLAKQAKRFTLVRSVYHSAPEHWLGHQQMLCGQVDQSASFPSWPCLLGRVKGGSGPLPPLVTVPRPVALTPQTATQLGQTAGYLGREWDPLVPDHFPPLPRVGGLDAGEVAFRVRDLDAPEGMLRLRAERRLRLLATDAAADGRIPNSSLQEVQKRAVELITSGAAQSAFDLQREPRSLRDRYGRNYVGQGAVLARRLVSAGVRLVTINWQGFTSGWDTHENNFRSIRESLAPALDAALSTLLADLDDHGLLETTIVVCMGEFGRSPKVEGSGGRGHWPQVMSVLLAGGPFGGGRVVGSSDPHGAEPDAVPIHGNDLLASLFHCFGVRIDDTVRGIDGRPVTVLPHGRVIPELFI